MTYQQIQTQFEKVDELSSLMLIKANDFALTKG